jgi:hypothetical protein
MLYALIKSLRKAAESIVVSKKKDPKVPYIETAFCVLGMN